MKDLQKQLTILRMRFEDYIKHKAHSSDSAKRPLSEDEEKPSNAKKVKLTEIEKDRSKFTLDSDGFLVVYTDGACGCNGRHGAKAGVGVYFGDDHPM